MIRRALALVLVASLGACNGKQAGQAPSDPAVIEHRSTEMTDDQAPPMKTRAPAPDAPRTRSDRTYPETVAGADALPAVTSAAELAAQDGHEVRLIGTYGEHDARMKQAPPPVHVGHVAITLADGTVVSFLPVHHKDALRPEAEIARYAGRQVEAVGVIARRAPADPRGGASPTGPALLAIKALRAR